MAGTVCESVHTQSDMFLIKRGETLTAKEAGKPTINILKELTLLPVSVG